MVLEDDGKKKILHLVSNRGGEVTGRSCSGSQNRHRKQGEKHAKMLVEWSEACRKRK